MHSNYSNVQYKSYCILKYKKKTVTKLWSNPLWSLSRQRDKSFQTHWWYEHKSLTAMSPMTSLSLFPFSQKVQKDVTAFKYVHDWQYGSHILYSVDGVSNFVETAKELWSFTFQKAQMSLKCWQPSRMSSFMVKNVWMSSVECFVFVSRQNGSDNFSLENTPTFILWFDC